MASIVPRCLLLLFFLAVDAQSVVSRCTPEAEGTNVVCESGAQASSTCEVESVVWSAAPTRPATWCNCPGGYRSTLSVASSASNEPCAFTTVPESTITLQPITCSITSPSASGLTLPSSWCTCTDIGLYATVVGNSDPKNLCSYNSAAFPATTLSPTLAECTLQSEGALDGGFVLPQTWCHCEGGGNSANLPTITPAAAGSNICGYTTAPATPLTFSNAKCSLNTASTIWPTAWCGCEGVTTLYPTPTTSSCHFTVAPTSTISTTPLVPTPEPTASCVTTNAANGIASPGISDAYTICTSILMSSSYHYAFNCDFNCGSNCSYINYEGASHAPSWCGSSFSLDTYMCELSITEISQQCEL